MWNHQIHAYELMKFKLITCLVLLKPKKKKRNSSIRCGPLAHNPKAEDPIKYPKLENGRGNEIRP